MWVVVMGVLIDWFIYVGFKPLFSQCT